MDYNGTLLSFEGIEGCGKTTQIQMLSKALTDSGYNVTCLREPGGTKFGEKLRSAILASDEPLAPAAEAMLFASSRAQLLHQVILPKLQNQKNIVILDRFIDSSFVYQGIARNMGIDQIEKIHSISPLTTRPDLTFYLRIDFEKSLERQRLRNGEKDYFEKLRSVGFSVQEIDYTKKIAPEKVERFCLMKGEILPVCFK
jgi:dTMP kinase